jgi:uncharacterized protein YcfJ
MDKSILLGLVIGGAAVTAAGAFAGYQAIEKRDSADVLAVEPVTETVKVPRQVCGNEVVSHQAPTRDPKRVTGAVVGGVVGGVVGNQIGGGSGKTIATVAGAAAGGYAGSKIQKGMQENNTYETTEARCATVYDSVEKSAGYDVRYRLDGVEHTVRMDHDPGSRIPVEDGRLVIERGARDG